MLILNKNFTFQFQLMFKYYLVFAICINTLKLKNNIFNDFCTLRHFNFKSSKCTLKKYINLANSPLPRNGFSRRLIEGKCNKIYTFCWFLNDRQGDCLSNNFIKTKILYNCMLIF